MRGPARADDSILVDMHASSLENMEKCFIRYMTPEFLASREQIAVLDIGGANVNGSYRDVFRSPRFRYLAADIGAGVGVDLVLPGPYEIPLDTGSIDVVLSGQTFEHSEFFWLTFTEMARVLGPDGYLFLIAPSSGPIHRYPVDCYRFQPDAYAALAKYSGCQLIDVWKDERGPWRDLVGVFRREGARDFPAREASLVEEPTGEAAHLDFRPGTPEEELTQGSLSRRDVLDRLHRDLAPSLYLEIGVRHGASLKLARGPAVGVDPQPEITGRLPDTTRIVKMTSDRFFEGPSSEVLDGRTPDLVLIDGMHHFQFALRDFMNVEAAAGPGTVVVIDDIYPNHPKQALRERCTQVWTGDVWKLHACLEQFRPDLFTLALDTDPTGLLLVAGLDPRNRVLWDMYNPIVRKYQEADPAEVPASVFSRKGAVDPKSPLVGDVISELTRPAPQIDLVRRLRKVARQTAAKQQPNQVDAPETDGRSFRSGLTQDVLAGIQEGVLRTQYRGVPFLKSPFDISLYLQLIGKLRPAAVVEIGAKAGGSALWFADMLTNHDIRGARVVSVDLQPPTGIVDDRIAFIKGDAGDLTPALSSDLMGGLGRPILVVEDSSHRYSDVLAVLRFFDGHLVAGDYIVVEDGILQQLPQATYARYDNGPNRAVREFLSDRGADYEIDRSLCDQFGFNATYNPNAWLRRTRTGRHGSLLSLSPA